MNPLHYFGLPFVLLVSACVAPPPPQVATPVAAVPARPAARPVQEVPQELRVPASRKSEELRRYYARAEERLLSQGLLRTDGGGADTPFTRRALVENFIRIALYDEYAIQNGRFVDQETPSRLRRWERPVRVRVHFGASVPPAQRERDRAEIRRYTNRLARLTGADIRMTDGRGNYHVLVMNADEMAASGPLLARLVPGIGSTTTNEIADLPRYTFCSVYAFSDRGSDNRYSAAVAVIRAEHTDTLRQSCIHEEMAQGLGLANDSPEARPSIFNDDEEFALLTRQDELMLRILYDRRLRPGMGPAEARPIVEQIATELMGPDS